MILIICCTQVITLVFNIFCGIILMLASFIMALFDATADVNDMLKNIYFCSPCFCLGYGLFELILYSINQVCYFA